MSKHTPGPWIEGKDKYGPFVLIPRPKSSFRSAMPSLEVARLAAAAPELLEALEIARAIIEERLPQTDDMRPIYEAIAKAKGDE